MLKPVVLLLLTAYAAGQGYGPDPDGVPSEFLCGWRSLAYNYSVKLRPDSAQKVYDALEYGKYCTGADAMPRPENVPQVWPPKGPVPNTPQTLYVDATKGSDDNPGTETAPLQTIQAAVDKRPQTVVLREGTFYLQSAVNVSEMITIQNYPGEEVWVSGGRRLENLKWSVVKGNIYKASLPKEINSMSGLRFNGERYWPARYPNANPETTAWPIGYLRSQRADWLPPKISPTPNPAKIVNVGSPSRSWDSLFSNYSGGIGGTCAIYDPPFSFWCQTNYSGGCGGCFTWNIPSGLQTDLLPKYPSLSDPTSPPLMNAWRQAHWANWQFEVDATNQTSTGKANPSTTFHFGKGGFQGARGGPGSDWYLSNVLEALDVPGEYFFDERDSVLYLYSNTTDAAAPSGEDVIVATQLHTLFRITGASQSKPVRNVTLSGLGFRDTTPTMLEPHGVPSGGDWALERIAAVFLENTENVKVTASKFTRIGGNGLMLSKYNQYAEISRNEFEWMGGSAVAAWGWTDEISDDGIHGYDGTGGDFPRYTTVEYNLFREIGVWEKQSSAFFQAKTAESYIRKNVVFNLARAGFNFNDGFGGGDVVTENVLFHTCRESSDHGPINSWDRQPFMTTVRTGSPDFQMAWRQVHHNIVIANYGGIKEVDTDDGSLFYKIHSNFMAYGWSQKFKCGGIHSFDNVKAYVTTGGYFNAGCVVSQQVLYPNDWHNDTLVKLEAQDFFYRDCWGSSPGHDWDKTQVGGNTIYIQKGFNAYVTCNKTNIPLAEFQKGGNDPGTRQINDVPNPDVILRWAVDTLGEW